MSQLLNAWRLAGQHGHLWAGAFADEVALDGVGRDEFLEKCAAHCADQPAGSVGGIPAPYWDEDGDINHTTGSGRLTWAIDGDGEVRLNVWRPGDVWACAARVVNGVVRYTEWSEECELRHWRVLQEAVGCVAEQSLAMGVPEELAARAIEAAEAALLDALRLVAVAAGLSTDRRSYCPITVEDIVSLRTFVTTWMHHTNNPIATTPNEE